MNQPHHIHHALSARALLALAAGAVAYLTLKPFVPRSPASFESVVDAAFSYDRETVQHVVPAIVLVVLARAGWGLRPMRATVVTFAGLLALEIVQLFVEQRHARMGDLGAQIIGLAIGSRLPIRPLAAWVWRSVWTATLLAWIALAITVGVRGQLGHTLGPMDTTFRLVVGDEHDGGRPWLGEVHAFAIATDVSPDPLVSFEVPPDSGPWQSTGALPIELRRAHAGWSSIDPVPALCEAVDDARTIYVSFEITSASIDQTGPARLVTISKGMAYRNLTIGQEGDALVLRVRTPRSGPNAASPQFVFPGVFIAGERMRLRLRSDSGTARLWINGQLFAEQASYTTPRDWLGLKPGPADAAGVIALFAPIGLAIGTLAGSSVSRRSRRFGPRVWIAAASVPIVILGLIWGTALVLHRPVAWWLLPSSAGVSLAGVAMAAMLRGRR